MADNVAITPGTGVTIASDDIAGVQYQIIKLAYGILDAATLVSATNPLPTMFNDPDVVATGTITATDAVVAAPAGDGTFRAGASTAGSTVAATMPGGDSAWMAQLTGTWTGTVHWEGTADGTNWIAINARQTGIVNTVLGYTATTNGLYRGNTSGFTMVRARVVGALTGSVAVALRVSGGVGAVFLNASIPAGTNNIGTVAQQASATATQTSVTASVTSVTVLAANAARQLATFFNDSTAVLYLLLGAGAASTTAHSVQIAAGGYYELPYRYTGALTGLWSAANGAARVTEVS